MPFVGSVDYLAAGQVTVVLPVMSDASGNSPFSQCYYSHVRIVPASSAVSVTTTFDSKPGVNYTTVGSPDVWAIPVTAKVMTVSPTGGSATAELGAEK